MSNLFEHCHGEKTHFSRNEKRMFSLSQMNNVELARTLSWRENALFEERKGAIGVATRWVKRAMLLVKCANGGARCCQPIP